MKIREIMTKSVRSCGPEDNLSAAAHLMWEGDCVIPVLENGKVKGMITDRDICIALATRGRRADEIKVGEVTRGIIYSCGPNDDVHSALATMRDNRVRRLPVVNDEGELAGMLSINDVILEAKERKGAGITYADALDVLKSICGHQAAAAAA